MLPSAALEAEVAAELADTAVGITSKHSVQHWTHHIPQPYSDYEGLCRTYFGRSV